MGCTGSTVDYSPPTKELLAAQANRVSNASTTRPKANTSGDFIDIQRDRSDVLLTFSKTKPSSSPSTKHELPAAVLSEHKTGNNIITPNKSNGKDSSSEFIDIQRDRSFVLLNFSKTKPPLVRQPTAHELDFARFPTELSTEAFASPLSIEVHHGPRESDACNECLWSPCAIAEIW